MDEPAEYEEGAESVEFAINSVAVIADYFYPDLDVSEEV